MQLLDNAFRRLRKRRFPLKIKVVLFGYKGLDFCPEAGVDNAVAEPCVSYNDLGNMLEAWFDDEANLRYNFSISDLAYKFGVRTAVLSDYFRLVLKKDFRSYKIERKIAVAKEILLYDEDVIILRVAERLGFRDKSNFHRQFKKYVGCTPRQWRNCSGHIDLCN